MFALACEEKGLLALDPAVPADEAAGTDGNSASAPSQAPAIVDLLPIGPLAAATFMEYGLYLHAGGHAQLALAMLRKARAGVSCVIFVPVVNGVWWLCLMLDTL